MIVLHFFVTTLLVYVLLIQVVGRLFGWKHEELKWNALAATLAMIILLTTIASPCTLMFVMNHLP
ncbi:hypothetical protein [uncultured Brevibacillus sp.]|uniref:hypothetical protein n=1 Tax=uncultured Brevibacillus sp. TaxID=169970 RepID=UPI00259A0BD6|nr:hypothetical protein [uncultured Brevibacillus sp.]